MTIHASVRNYLILLGNFGLMIFLSRSPHATMKFFYCADFFPIIFPTLQARFTIFLCIFGAFQFFSRFPFLKRRPNLDHVTLNIIQCAFLSVNLDSAAILEAVLEAILNFAGQDYTLHGFWLLQTVGQGQKHIPRYYYFDCKCMFSLIGPFDCFRQWLWGRPFRQPSRLLTVSVGWPMSITHT